MMRGNFYM
jgi:hypothetical protein